MGIKVTSIYISQFCYEPTTDKQSSECHTHCLQACSLILREEHRLNVLQNRMLGERGEEVKGDRRQLHNKELHGL